MLKNIFKSTVRSIIKEKNSFLLNVTGLSISLCSAILIMLWIVDEISFDHFFKNYENIYQVRVNSKSNGVIKTEKALCYPLYEELKNQDPKIVNTCLTGWTYGHSITYGNMILQKEVLPVSEEFVEMFELPLLYGSTSDLFSDPYSIVLSESVARDIFKNEDPINKYIIYDNNKELKVTGVFKDLPRNSSFWFHALVPITFYEKTEKWITHSKNDWGYFEYQVFVQLLSGTPENNISNGLKDILKEKNIDNNNYDIFLHGMDRWHLYSIFENGKEAGGKIEYVRLFCAIAILTLLIACINFMNLTTARSEKRGREVGIRKSFGSSQGELMLQFFAEPFLITLLSFAISILLVELSLPYYNGLVLKTLSIEYSSIHFWLSAGLLIIVISFLSGAYPAIYFSSFQPHRVLKGIFFESKTTKLPHTIALTIQYSFSIFLIIGMIIIFQQIQLVKNRQLGYNKENLLMIPTNDEMISNYHLIKQELLNNGLAESVTRSNQPITGSFWSESINWNGKNQDENVVFTSISADFDYAKTMNIRIVEGRDFSPEFLTDSSAILVNKKAVEVMGFSEPIGHKIRLRDREWTIIGVLDDVLMGSPFEPIDPLFVAIMGDWNNYITIRLLESSNNAKTIEHLDVILNKHNPSNIHEKIFVEGEFNYKFREIELVSTLSKLFAFLALVITCMGVFGLAAYVAEGRKKEVAIRKVLGAENVSLLLLLSNSFTKIILVSSLVTIPISVIFMNHYLKNYSYQIDIQWWIMPIVLTFILLITLVIVTIQVSKTVRTNPVNSLKSE